MSVLSPHIQMRVTLRVLGLAKVAESIVGSGELRGISGGERRRLSIALEVRPFVIN
jgi:ABC-type multidrug transport system ATPase subunit